MRVFGWKEGRLERLTSPQRDTFEPFVWRPLRVSANPELRSTFAPMGAHGALPSTQTELTP